MFNKCKNYDANIELLAILINEVATKGGSDVSGYRIVVAGNNLRPHSEETLNC
jgi:hypothetical protein